MAPAPTHPALQSNWLAATAVSLAPPDGLCCFFGHESYNLLASV
jgi:hypothetical protein